MVSVQNTSTHCVSCAADTAGKIVRLALDNKVDWMVHPFVETRQRWAPPLIRPHVPSLIRPLGRREFARSTLTL